TLTARQAEWQADHDLERLVLLDEGDETGDGLRTGLHGLDRRGDHPVRVARGDADPRVAHVDTESSAPAPRHPRKASRTAANAGSMPPRSVPPPWATSALPPPRPPMRSPTSAIRSFA